MKTVYFAATSLDGYIADKHNSLEWLFSLSEPGNYIDEFLSTVGVIAMGSTTYQWILDHLKPDEPWPYKVPSFVFTSKKREAFPGADIAFVNGDVKPVYERMKEIAGENNIWIVGGGDLAGQFYDARLLDQMIIQIASITLGAGAPLFPRQLSHPLKLQSARRLGKDFVEIIYDVSRI